MSVLPIPPLPLHPGAVALPLPQRPSWSSPRLPGSVAHLVWPAGWLAGVLVGLGLWMGCAAAERAFAQDLPQGVELQCRLSGGPWQPCRMEIQNVGMNWSLRIGEERIEFRHGGDGSVTMQKGAGPWQPVMAIWSPDTSLCWDGVCAKGDIPLD